MDLDKDKATASHCQHLRLLQISTQVSPVAGYYEFRVREEEKVRKRVRARDSHSHARSNSDFCPA